MRLFRFFGGVNKDTLLKTVQRYGQHHVNPDDYTVVPSKPVPEGIERPKWLLDHNHKYSNYDSVFLLKDPQDIASRLL